MDLHPRSPPQLSTTGAVSTEPLPGQRRLLGSLQSDEASSDSAWEPLSAGSSGVSSAEDNMAEASDSESLEEYSVDGSIVLSDDQLREEVTSLIQRDNCEERCLQGKAAELYNFSCSLSHMSSREKKQSVMTALAMRMKMDTAGVVVQCFPSFDSYYHPLSASDTRRCFLSQGTWRSAEH
ncbi:hypothetical protein PC117_g18694 [Phytophthora cactorum]|uniref:Uncharacterized protein n=1 Tax=Phytophthora cactorum TaxID=29920 RepID=A0A8T1C1K4_9STRA|nr:hypothetical protein PC117_g18694 [Phytophthora cactorum]